MTTPRLLMEVHGLALDPRNNGPIVVLRHADSGRILPIWIGVVEASAIAFELEKVKPARPMTHDLFLTALGALGAQLVESAIVDLRDNTYFATLGIARGNSPAPLRACAGISGRLWRSGSGQIQRARRAKTAVVAVLRRGFLPEHRLKVARR